MTTQRKIVTNRTRSWVFKKAHAFAKMYPMSTFADMLKKAWRMARIAAGIIKPTYADVGAVGLNGSGKVYSLKALAAGQTKRVWRNPRFETHAL